MHPLLECKNLNYLQLPFKVVICYVADSGSIHLSITLQSHSVAHVCKFQIFFIVLLFSRDFVLTILNFTNGQIHLNIQLCVKIEE